MLRRHVELTDAYVIRCFVYRNGANSDAVTNNVEKALCRPALSMDGSLIRLVPAPFRRDMWSKGVA